MANDWGKFLDAIKAGATIYAGETVHQSIVKRCGPLAAGVKLCKWLNPMDVVAIDETKFNGFGADRKEMYASNTE